MQDQLRAIATPERIVSLAQLSTWLNEQKRIAGHPLNAKLFAQAVLQRLLQSCQLKASG
jgi:DNA polymerase-3 subunit delta'